MTVRAVHRDLHALHCERREPICGCVVDARTVGLDLERDARSRQLVEEFPAVRDGERFTTAEGYIGNARLDDAPGEVQGLPALEFVGPRIARPRRFAARNAAPGAAIRELPGDEQGRPVLVDRAALRKRI